MRDKIKLNAMMIRKNKKCQNQLLLAIVISVSLTEKNANSISDNQLFRIESYSSNIRVDF